MQVFKLYAKLLRANMKSFFIYIGIFSGLLFGVIIPNQTRQEKGGFVESRCNFAICDEDQTPVSGSVADALRQMHNEKTLKDFSFERIQDQLFYREVNAVVILKEGFGDALKKGKTAGYADIYVIPGTMNGKLFEQDFNGLLSKIQMYKCGGYEITEAIAKAAAINDQKLEVRFLDNQAPAAHGPSYYFFIYLAWIFIAVCIQSVSPVLCIMDQKEVKNRVYISAYRFSQYNLGTLFSTIITGLGMCLLFLVLAGIVLPDNIFSLKGALWMLNMLSFMVVTMGLTLLASKLTTSLQVISAISNIISLGMAFLCGVFVPMELLGDGVISVAHFLPAYWYVHAVDLISNYSSGNLSSIFTCMGIELLFGAAIIAVSFLVAKRKAV